MATHLIIVESPTKARTISSMLGKEFIVLSSMGHVRDLPEKKFAVDINNNFKPEYVVTKNKVVDNLKKYAITAKSIYLATDPDREGEAIAYHIKELLNLKDDKIRCEFHEITKSAVEEAINNPRRLNINLVHAQQARRILDRIVGYKLSPLLWEKISGQKGVLSAGRVQSVAVRLVVEREEEIEKFKKEEYWTIDAVLLTKDNKEFKARLVKKNEKEIKISTEQEAINIINELKQAQFIVSEIKEEEKKKDPLPPFITSTLQQEANKNFNYTAEQTMSIAQQLYEGINLGEKGRTGLITYMRTDSTRVSKKMQYQTRNFIKQRFGEHYLPNYLPQYKSKKGAQEAHEAIRPTFIELQPDEIKQYLTKPQYGLYKLIYYRFLASQMIPAVISTKLVNIKANSYLFQTNEYKILFDGFMRVYGKDKEKLLPQLSVNDELSKKSFENKQHFTQPRPRYTEATLIKELEEKGVGRPSTYAPIMETIKKRKYVTKIGKYLKATNLAKTVTKLLVENFTNIMDIKFTATMEENLDNIEEGKEKWVTVLKEFYESFSKELEEAQEKIKRIKVEPEKVDVRCEKCGSQMIIKEGKFGRFLACPNYPQCKTTKPINATGIKCKIENCTGEILRRKSKKGGIFYSCSKYPTCKFISKTLPK